MIHGFMRACFTSAAAACEYTLICRFLKAYPKETWSGINFIGMISCGSEEVRAVLWREGIDDRCDGLPEIIDGSGGIRRRTGGHGDFADWIADRLVFEQVGRINAHAEDFFDVERCGKGRERIATRVGKASFGVDRGNIKLNGQGLGDAPAEGVVP